MKACLHSTQKRIGLLAMWCLHCGALKLEDGEWRLPAKPPEEPDPLEVAPASAL